MSPFKKALVLSALVVSTIVLSSGTPPAMAAPASGGDIATSGTWHCC